jgi:hypothetical protein
MDITCLLKPGLGILVFGLSLLTIWGTFPERSGNLPAKRLWSVVGALFIAGSLVLRLGIARNNDAILSIAVSVLSLATASLVRGTCGNRQAIKKSGLSASIVGFVLVVVWAVFTASFMFVS